MKQAGEVLLVSCYELGHQPHALASPLGFLRRAGFQPAAIDLAVERLDPERVRRARFVAISVPMHTALRLGVRAAAEVRRLAPAAHVCFYGLYAPLNQAYLRAHGADSVIGGEAEAELVALVERLAAGDAAPPRARVLDRLDFAPPSREGLPALDRYAQLERGDGTRAVAGYTEASRGCLHRCRHCPIPPLYGGRFFVVPRELVVEDVRRLVAAGAAHVTFGDPDFLNGPGHALAIARAVHAEFPSLTWDMTAKVEHLLGHRALLPELGALGCLFVTSAVESVDDRVLAILDKGHTAADVVDLVAAMRAAGIALRPSLVPFTPWTTLEGYLALLDFLVAHDLVDAVDPVQLSIRLLVPPGSLLLDHPEMRPHLGALDPSMFTHTWMNPDPRVDELQRAVYRAVERAATDGEPPRETFAEVHRLACAAAGRPAPLPVIQGRARPSPRLTEAWFC